MMTVTNTMGNTPVRETIDPLYVGVVIVATVSLIGEIKFTPTTMPIIMAIRPAMFIQKETPPCYSLDRLLLRGNPGDGTEYDNGDENDGQNAGQGHYRCAIGRGGDGRYGAVDGGDEVNTDDDTDHDGDKSCDIHSERKHPLL